MASSLFRFVCGDGAADSLGALLVVALARLHVQHAAVEAVLEGAVFVYMFTFCGHNGLGFVTANR
jgi:hypothetical protein